MRTFKVVTIRKRIGDLGPFLCRYHRSAEFHCASMEFSPWRKGAFFTGKNIRQSFPRSSDHFESYYRYDFAHCSQRPPITGSR